MTRPLARVLVTRHEGPDGPLSSALRAAGLEPVLAPTFTFVSADPPPDPSELRTCTWAAWTSTTAVAAMAELLADRSLRLRHAAVGGATAAALAARGLEVEIVGEGGSSDLAELLVAELGPDDRLVYPRSDRADASFAERVRSFGVAVHDPIAYRIGPADPALVRDAIETAPEAVAFASPSAVTGLAEVLEADPKSSDGPWIETTLFASIGPTTSAALRNRLREPDVEAPTPDFGSLARALATTLADRAPAGSGASTPTRTES